MVDRVLVVDDEEGIRSFVAECLETEGHSVARAACGEEAWRRLQDERFGLVISDLRMPGMSGMDLLQRVHAEQPGVELILLTAHGDVPSAVQAMKLGAFDYLQKPVGSPAELRQLAARALARRAQRAPRERPEPSPAEPALTYGDPAMQRVMDSIRKVSSTDATILLLGESGTGKEVTARAIHQMSRRAQGPFVAINCATLSEHLLESELFGHEKGAFTGATERKRGRIELAHGGTFFLDEIGEMKPDLQARLLRVLQERTIDRVGGSRPVEVDVRFIAATHRDLRELIAKGAFREDLYHRLSVFPVRLPALRERPADILPLAEVLLARTAQRIGRPGLTLSDEAKAALLAARWPGNIRELANVLERAAILAEGTTLEVGHLELDPQPVAAAEPLAGAQTLEQLEQQAITRALYAAEGNRRKAAECLGIGLRTLYEKIKRYGLAC